jgi:hypothetical protein
VKPAVIAMMILGACVAAALALVAWAIASRPTRPAGLAVAPVAAPTPAVALAPWDDPCPARMAPIADDPTFGAAPSADAHALVIAELEALLAEGRGPMRELRDRAHVASLDAATMEAGRHLGCAQRRNGSRANRLLGYVDRLLADRARSDREWLLAAGDAADRAFRCVDGEPNAGAQPSCDAVAEALASLRPAP